MVHAERVGPSHRHDFNNRLLVTATEHPSNGHDPRIGAVRREQRTFSIFFSGDTLSGRAITGTAGGIMNVTFRAARPTQRAPQPARTGKVPSRTPCADVAANRGNDGPAE